MVMNLGEERSVLLKRSITGWVAGAVAFPVALAASQKVLWKPLRISYSPKWRSSLAGLASVAVASFGASSAALGIVKVMQQWSSSTESRYAPTIDDVYVSTLGGVVLFKLFGGQYSRVLPSNLMRPGAFGVGWIPSLNGSVRATLKERQVVNFLGRKHGCHTCGERQKLTYIADHQPPSKLLGKHQSGTRQNDVNPLLQRLYPQCPTCSNAQGGLLATHGTAAIRRSGSIRTHPFNLRNLRWHHFVFCLPIPLCATYVRASFPVTQPQTADCTEAKKDEPQGKEKPVADSQSKKTEAKKSEERSSTGPSEMWLDSEMLSNFPLFIMWRKITEFLDSFHDPLASFHITLWAFIIIAALGTI